jgi:hypothetical protein
MPAKVQAFQAVASSFTIPGAKSCTFAAISYRKPHGAVKACKNAGISQLPERKLPKAPQITP